MTSVLLCAVDMSGFLMKPVENTTLHQLILLKLYSTTR